MSDQDAGNMAEIKMLERGGGAFPKSGKLAASPEAPQAALIPERWKGRYSTANGPMWNNFDWSPNFSMVVEELGTAEARIAELEAKLLVYEDAGRPQFIKQLSAVTKERDEWKQQALFREAVIDERDTQHDTDLALIRELEDALRAIKQQAVFAGMEDTPLYGIPDAAIAKLPAPETKP